MTTDEVPAAQSAAQSAAQLVAAALNAADNEVYLAIDALHVAQDFLSNLLGPSGRDVVARELTGKRRLERVTDTNSFSITGFLTSRRPPPVPQGDQLRRTRVALQEAIVSVDAAVNHCPPPGFEGLWSEVDLTVRDADLAGGDALLDPTLDVVKAAMVAEVSRRVRATSHALNRIRQALVLARIRAQGP